MVDSSLLESPVVRRSQDIECAGNHNSETDLHVTHSVMETEHTNTNVSNVPKRHAVWLQYTLPLPFGNRGEQERRNECRCECRSTREIGDLRANPIGMPTVRFMYTITVIVTLSHVELCLRST